MTAGRMSSFPSLELVPEGADITFGTLAETGETMAVASYARAIAVSFQLLVNDDLDAIGRSVRDVAFAAQELKSKLILAALAATMSDGLALFHATHGNLAATGAPPDVPTLFAARLAMRKQRALDATTPLGISPAIFLVPPELETAADTLVATINRVDPSTVNPFMGKLAVAVEPRLTNATAWYLFAPVSTFPAGGQVRPRSTGSPRPRSRRTTNGRSSARATGFIGT